MSITKAEFLKRYAEASSEANLNRRLPNGLTVAEENRLQPRGKDGLTAAQHGAKILDEGFAKKEAERAVAIATHVALNRPGPPPNPHIKPRPPAPPMSRVPHPSAKDPAVVEAVRARARSDPVAWATYREALAAVQALIPRAYASLYARRRDGTVDPAAYELGLFLAKRPRHPRAPRPTGPIAAAAYDQRMDRARKMVREAVTEAAIIRSYWDAPANQSNPAGAVRSVQPDDEAPTSAFEDFNKALSAQIAANRSAIRFDRWTPPTEAERPAPAQ